MNLESPTGNALRATALPQWIFGQLDEATLSGGELALRKVLTTLSEDFDGLDGDWQATIARALHSISAETCEVERQAINYLTQKKQ